MKYWYELTPVTVRSREDQLLDLHRMLVVAVRAGITSVDEIYAVVNGALAGREAQCLVPVIPENPPIPESREAA